MNMNYKRLNEILGIGVDWDKNRDGKLHLIEWMDLKAVMLLIQEGFVDINEGHSEGPMASSIYNIIARIPPVMAHGYIVPPGRPDARVTLTGIMAKPNTLTEKQLTRLVIFSNGASELEAKGITEVFWAWWD